ncbi:hypothetical protein Tco_1391784 [Tanacetum coccineum]
MLLTARKRVRPPPALAPVLETAITTQIAAPPLLSSRSPSEYSSAPPLYAIPSRRRSRYVSLSFETSSSPPPRKRHIGDTIQTMIEPVTPPTHPQPTIEERLDEQYEWNSHVKTVGFDAAYGMPWNELPKMMTEVYCPRNEVQKMENNGPDEEKKIERYIWGLPYRIQGNVTSSVPTRLQDAIKMANNLMDQKVHANAARQAKKGK